VGILLITFFIFFWFNQGFCVGGYFRGWEYSIIFFNKQVIKGNKSFSW
jgi:hypothetical protein